ncbi:hypothetical protein NMG60_11012762 [Bertholletia excelsa]
MVEVVERHEMPNGWPFGLGNLNIRLQVRDNSQPAAAAELRPLHALSSSFSSFSSSNLDTESTASFFQDHSVSLGRLIGMTPRERRVLYLPNRTRLRSHENALQTRPYFAPSEGQEGQMYQGICVPLLVRIVVKMSRSKSRSRQ